MICELFEESNCNKNPENNSNKMKLWKTKKPISCVSSSSTKQINQNKDNNNKNDNKKDVIPLTPILSGDRAMSPAQSEDSGLATDSRVIAYSTVTLPRENAQTMGIAFIERPDLSYPPIIGTVNPSGAAADFLAPGDRILQIDGISSIGLSNQHVMSLLCHGDGAAIIEIEYNLPEYISQNSLCVTSKIAQVTVERENGCLGLTLRGGGDYPLVVTHVRPHGPVFKTGRIKPGDRLLRVDNLSLINKPLTDAQQLLKSGHNSGLTNLTIEYDVSVMQSVEYAMSPLLIEIERPLNDHLGLVLANYSPVHDHLNVNEVQSAGVYIASILPASIADRCGALSVGDQILSIDDTNLENAAFSPDEAMALLDINTGRGYTQIQIMPANAIIRRGQSVGSNKYGSFNTLESRKSRNRRLATTRKSNSGTSLGPQNSNSPGLGVCRAETVQVILDITHGSGLILGGESSCGRSIVIAQVIEDSVADRSGCIQSGDRIMAINKMYNLDVNTVRQLLGDIGPRPLGYQGTNWMELEIEFDMSDAVIPSSGVFNVKLVRMGKGGLGLTVNGSSHGGAFIITEVKPGSPAHRTGSLRAGDILMAVDSHPLQHFNVDALLKDNPNDVTTLTIKRDSIPDFLFDAQQRSLNSSYGTTDRDIYVYSTKYGEVKYKEFVDGGSSIKSTTPQPEYVRAGPAAVTTAEDFYGIRNNDVNFRRPYNKLVNAEKFNTVGRNFGAEQTQSLTTEITEDCYNDLSTYDMDYVNDPFGTIESSKCGEPELPPPMFNEDYETHQIVQTVRLEPKGGPLGITLAGSEDLNKTITISGIADGGTAFKSRQLKMGDSLLAINGESIQGMPLSHATKLLQQNLDEIVHLKVLRTVEPDDGATGNIPQPQSIYTNKTNIQNLQTHRPSPASFNDGASTSSKDSKHRSMHITLFKDKVYDDYGFSVSDGLYEKGVFINRIRSGGPADRCGLLKPFDRIVQVNGTKTIDFDCCLTVPLIAAAGDKIELIIQRPES